MRERLRAFLTSEAKILILIASAGLLVFAFTRIASVVATGDVYAIDLAILGWFRVENDPEMMIGSFWFREAVRDITALGSGIVLTLIVVFVALLLLLLRERVAAIFVVLASASAGLTSEGLKFAFGRPRPEFSAYADQLSASFPSGHAMISAAVFLAIGAVLARMTSQRRLRVFLFGTAIFLTATIGATRVLLGVHYPSDVVAGWAMGAAWALGWSTIALVVERHLRPKAPR